MKNKIKNLLMPIILLCTFGIVLNMAYNLREAQITIIKLKQNHKRSLDAHKQEFEKLMLFSEQLVAGKITELKKQQSKHEHQMKTCVKQKSMCKDRVSELEEAMEVLALQYLLNKRKLQECEMI